MRPMKTQKVCPKCGKSYSGYPALSREDGKTQICSDCGTREALEAIGASKELQEEILRNIHEKTSLCNC